KRILTGESFFITMFGNGGARRADVAFAAPVPGKIKALDLREWGGEIIAQKDSFLCAARGISLDIAFTRRIGAGFFGGEGFILQRLNGDGLAFVHACGALIERELKPGEQLRVDTGCLVAMQSTVDYDIRAVPGIKNALFGGEGIFLVHLTGPGKVILQTLPFARMADKIIAASRMGGGQRRDEGGVLGPLGDILSGDRR
ncbi:MAG: AIM24 family protein, partial [Gemmatimonadaceae bacterium]